MLSFNKVKPHFLSLIFFLFGLFLPVQLGRHFWPEFAYIHGVRVDYLSPTFFLTDILLLCLMFYKRDAFIKTINQLGKQQLFVFIFSFILLGFFAFAADKYLFLYRLLQYAKIVLVAALLAHSTLRERTLFLYGLFCSSIYVLIMSLLQIQHTSSLNGVFWLVGERTFNLTTPGISTVSINGVTVLRPYATFSHPNSLAGFYLVTFFLLVRSRLFLLSTLAACLVFASFSKIAIIVFALLWALSALLEKKRCMLCILARSVIGVTLVMIAFLWKGDTASVVKRFDSLRYGAERVLTQPWGTGLGNYLTGVNLSYQPIHNSWLLYTVETGVFGLLLCAFFFVSLKNHLNKNRSMIIPLLAVVLTGLFDHYWLTLIQNQLLLGAVIGFIFAPLPTKESAYSH